ncbi:MAG: chloride channel protein, partial [Spirochaetia bacterium]
VAGRQELRSALASNTVPRLTTPVLCAPRASVREAGALLMESGSGMVLIRDDSTGDISSVVTLHDLLRAQAALSE